MQEVSAPVEAVVSETTVLALPEAVVSYFVPTKNRTVLVAENRGNWLVVDEQQRLLYEELSSGKSIGEVLRALPESGADSLIALLSQIYARSFFAEDGEPVSSPRGDVSVFVYLTYACNLRCSHCYMYRAVNREVPLTVEEYRHLFDVFAAKGVKSITFSGGEPLLHPDFEEIVRMAKAYDFSVTVLSNGTQWTGSRIAFAKENIDEVQISVDGVDDDSCSLVRGPDVFCKAVETAVALSNAGVLTSVATTPVSETADEIEKGYREFAGNLLRRTNGKIIFRISSKLLDGRTCGHSDSFSATAEKLADQIYTDDKCRTFSINHPPNSGLRSCGWGSLTISPDGFVYPCNRVDDCVSLGSVRGIPAEELFRRAAELAVLSDVDHTEPCCTCALRYLCGGGCRLDDFESLSHTAEVHSFHKSCSPEKKRRILETMVETTDYLYSFGQQT